MARSIGLHGIRVEPPDDVDAAVQAALAHPGPMLLVVVNNPDEIAILPRATLSQCWGFAVKTKEFLDSRE